MVQKITASSTGVVRAVGRRALAFLHTAGGMWIFLSRAASCLFGSALKFTLLLQQIRFVGAQSVLLICLTGAFTGMVLGFQGFYTLARFGSEAFVGPMVALGLITELGPVITALMVTARAGSAVTAEIAVMRIGEQIDALEMMGLNPFRYLVVPNLLAALICMPLLTAIFDVVGIYGGYLVAVKLLGLGAGTYMGEMATRVDMHDIMLGFNKSLSFGLIIAWVCCYKGYTARLGAKGVGKATTEAVVLSSVLIVVGDYFMTSVLK